jgi:hypothetical protein
MTTPIIENLTVKFTIKATNSVNKPIYWYLEGLGVTPECFEGGAINGSTSITETKVVEITLKKSPSLADLKNFKLVVKNTNATGAIVISSDLITVVTNVLTTTTTTTEAPVVP